MAHFHDIHNGTDIPTPQDGEEMTHTCSSTEEIITTVGAMDEAENNTSMRGEGVDSMFVKATAICPPGAHFSSENQILSLIVPLRSD